MTSTRNIVNLLFVNRIHCLFKFNVNRNIQCSLQSQEHKMELTGKTIKYSTFAWKLALQNYVDEQDDDDTMIRFCMNDGRLSTFIPVEGELEQFTETYWSCLISRENKNIPNGKVTAKTYASVSIGTSERIVTGFCKFCITDENGKTLPGQIKYAYVDYDSCRKCNVSSVIFDELKPLENSEVKCFVCFEFYIAVDERQTSDFNRSTNDLSLLLDESLLTDTVLRVRGREIAVHRAILAARTPRFYDNFLAGSKDSVVDVGEIEPDVFRELLKCFYSNRIPTALFQEPAFQDMAQMLEPTCFSEQIPTDEQQHSVASSANTVAVDLDEFRGANPYRHHEIRVSTQNHISFRCFSYNTVISMETYRGPTFSFEEIFNTVFEGEDEKMITATWKISLKEFDEAPDMNYFTIELMSLNNASSVIARIRMCILNGRGEKHIDLTKFEQFSSNYETRFQLDKELMKKLRQRFLVNHHFDDSDMTICLDIDIQADDMDDHLTLTSSDDLGRLLVDGILSDVVLLVGDRKFPVHRAILAAKSPVFRAMFTSDMKEAVAEEILIEDMEPDLMEGLLRCVYTDQVPVECGCDMLIAFDRFGLTNLLDRCQDSVTITVENALEMFAVAEEWNAKSLKMRILKFLKNREAHMPHKTN